ncbi:DPBB and LysM peptidoglycan-binding domain-containing protein [Companilactobacillus versmoldensis]|uniref:LysM domain-containing protein n=1 Tax=Companilactobacillus versmoldensis DSM 14857 = KCTC 3814 TaxID=1423815 RepID=A0A0R1SEG8_9LACO|nr:LysM peptidoglycan-binding domain-containing protein [Companilactobacillus versmoldensis]KRL67585.1 hypothetical protein FC27_GL001609 [Companilactobacillus versmoldensis DSM 14857 = KCTC 3814]
MKKVLSLAFVSAMALTAFGIKTSTSQAATTLDSSHVSVVAGDSYKSIAEANGVSVAALEQANGRQVGGFDLIFPGETITLPTSNAAAQNTTATQQQNTQAQQEQAQASQQQAQAQQEQQAQAQQEQQAQAQKQAQQAQAQQQQAQASQQQAQATQQQNTQAATQTATQNTQSSASTQSAGQYKISFYDPAVLGSNMGYSGVAANLSVFPKGTQLKITLSDGTVMYRTVNDTGTFANSNPNQLDVAMPNASIPSYGVTTASVEVVG